MFAESTTTRVRAEAMRSWETHVDWPDEGAWQPMPGVVVADSAIRSLLVRSNAPIVETFSTNVRTTVDEDGRNSSSCR